MVKEKTSTPTLMASDDNIDLLDDDESLLIKDGSSPLTGMDINMGFTLPTEFRGAKEEDAQMCLGPKEAMFEKLEESSQHLKPLYVRGHINRKLICRMLIESGIAINLMSYSIFKKLGREDDEVVMTKLTLNSVGVNLMEARGVISIELMIGSKSLAIAFLIVEVQGNYSVILGCNWIHTNDYIPCTLHQFLIQWVDDEVEAVHTDESAYITLADATADWQHGSAPCLSGKYLIGYDFLSVSEERFVPVFEKPASKAWLSNVLFQ
jgi:hypothetical protein